MKHKSFTGSLVLPMLATVFVSSPLLADDGDPANEFRLTLSPYHPIKGNLSGFTQLGYYYNPDKDYSRYYLGWPRIVYAVKPWLQLWGGLMNMYTDNLGKTNQLELRPFAGVKLFILNQAKINLYNFTRYEYRMTDDLDSGDWTYVNRIRSRFGAEVPLTSRENAWQTNTFYSLVDAEYFYRFDRDVIDPLRVRAGVAYILNDRLRLEFIYHAGFTRKDESGTLEYTENIFRLNIKIGLTEGILRRVLSPSSDD